MNSFESRQEELIKAAARARAHAHAPYSNFAVGAALLDASGGVHAAANVENASFGLTQCAERNAVAHAVSEGHREFLGLVVVGGSSQAAAPCGACRQVLAEFARSLPILLVSESGERRQLDLANLLPERFDGSALGVDP